MSKAHPSGPAERRSLLRRVLPSRPRDTWKVLVPLVALLAGLLAATTAHTARGTDLRSSGRTNIADLIRKAEGKVASSNVEVRDLQQQVAAETDQLARSDAVITRIKDGAKSLTSESGLVAMSGPGLTVTLNDAHPTSTDSTAVDLNRLVVHQSDMQAVVNALWAGGAEAISVMNQRLVNTSAIRCVGNTLLLNGQVYSPPFSVAAIGPEQAMRDALNASRDLGQYRQDAKNFGLGYNVDGKGKIDVPAYEAPISMTYAVKGQ